MRERTSWEYQTTTTVRINLRYCAYLENWIWISGILNVFVRSFISRAMNVSIDTRYKGKIYE